MPGRGWITQAVQKGRGWMVVWSWHRSCLSLDMLLKTRLSAEYLKVSIHSSLHSDLVFQREFAHIYPSLGSYQAV